MVQMQPHSTLPRTSRKLVLAFASVFFIIAAVLITLYATGIMRISPSADGHAVDVDINAPPP
jgi:hypothetical protein